MEIQKLGIADIDSLQPLVTAFVQSHPSLPFRADHWTTFRNWLSKSVNDDVSLCLVARAGIEPVGFIVGDIRENGPLLSPEKIGHVSVLVVNDRHRSKGIGETLWNELHRWFVSNGIDHFELYTEHTNTTSRLFWQKRGFEVFLEKRQFH